MATAAFGANAGSRGRIQRTYHPRMPSLDTEYVLGTHDEEIARLALQHRVWADRVHAAWRQAGFSDGQHLADIGCGPGFAALELARLVGPTGRVTAIDQSRRFLDQLAAQAAADALDNIALVERDLNTPRFEPAAFDGAWIRWVLAFVPDPRQLLADTRAALRAGSPLVIYEYFDNRTWRMSPPHEGMEHFVRVASDNWRRAGGEPNIALSALRWLEELGFRIVHLRPIIDIVTAQDPQWHWLTAFVESGRKRLTASRELSVDASEALAVAIRAWLHADPPVRMVTPGVMEIIAIA
jgi:SAM-dependent methyltransferase